MTRRLLIFHFGVLLLSWQDASAYPLDASAEDFFVSPRMVQVTATATAAAAATGLFCAKDTSLYVPVLAGVLAIGYLGIPFCPVREARFAVNTLLYGIGS